MSYQSFQNYNTKENAPARDQYSSYSDYSGMSRTKTGGYSSYGGLGQQPQVQSQAEQSHQMQQQQGGQFQQQAQQQQAMQQQSAQQKYVVEVENRAHHDSLLANSRVVVIKAHATWCQPCKAVAPQYEVMAQMYSSQIITFASEDVELGVLGSEVTGVPTFLYYLDGQLVHKVVGANIDEVEQGVQVVLERVG